VRASPDDPSQLAEKALWSEHPKIGNWSFVTHLIRNMNELVRCNDEKLRREFSFHDVTDFQYPCLQGVHASFMMLNRTPKTE
jgi:hypothetical protein